MGILLLAITIAGGIVWFARWRDVYNIPRRDINILENTDSDIKINLPPVSILVPARDEEENIYTCLNSLIHQEYPDFEIIVIDDRSTDRTPQILNNLKPASQLLRVLKISELPQGWTGKTHALYQGSKIARGKWFLFTDADTVHSPLSLKSSIIYAIRHDIDFLSLYPSSRSNSFWEKITQPLGGGILHLWYPFEQVNNPNNKISFANGQFILIKRQCYQDIGGHENVKGELLEDVAMAEIAKTKCKKIRMAYGFSLFSTRMYKGILNIWRGWRRIFGVLMRKKKTRYPVSLGLISLFSLLPFVIVFNISLISKGGIWLIIYLINIFDIIFLYLTTGTIYRLSKNNPFWSIFHPVGCFIMFSVILDASIREIFRRPIRWRGTLYRN